VTPRRTRLATLDIPHIDHGIADRRIGALLPSLRTHVPHRRGAGRKPRRRERHAALITGLEGAFLLKCIQRFDLGEAGQQ